MAPPVQVTDEIEYSELILSIYTAKEIAGAVYIDDGRSLDYKDGYFSLLTCQGKASPGKISISLKRNEGNLEPVLSHHPYIAFFFHIDKKIEKVKSVVFCNTPLDEINERKTGWRLINNRVQVIVENIVIPLTIEIQYY